MTINTPSKRFMMLGCGVLCGLAAYAYWGEVQLRGVVHGAFQYRGDGRVVEEVVRNQYGQTLEVEDSTGLVIQVRAGSFPQYQFGEVLEIECLMSHPDTLNSDEFAYGRYLRMQGIDAVCDQSTVNTKNEHTRLGVKGWLVKSRQYIGSKVREIWAEPNASFIAGILYGDRAGLPKELKDQFSAAGLTHIMAVSGYNVTIVANVMMAVLRGVGVGRKKSFGVVLIAVVGFVIFVGASASAVRAGIMGVVALLGKTLGRGSRAGPVIVASVLLMTVGNPMLLLYDVGLHLSVLATMGLIYVAPLIEPYLQWLTERFGLREAVSTTLAATIITAPILSYVFGTVSIITVLANLVVLPLIPVLMIVSAIATSVSLVSVVLGKVVGVVAWGISAYVLLVTRLASTVPYGLVELQMSLPIVILMYSMLTLWWYKKKQKPILSWD